MKKFELDILNARYQEARARITKLRREKALNEIEEKHLASLIEKQLEMDKNIEKLALRAKDDLEALMNNAMKLLLEDPELPYIYLTYEEEDCDDEDEEINNEVRRRQYYLTPRGILVVIIPECQECIMGIYEIPIQDFLDQIKSEAGEIHYIANNILHYYETKATVDKQEKEEEDLVYIR